MPFRHRKASLALLSVLGLTLSACQPASTTPGSTLPQITPSAAPSNPLPVTSPVPGASVAPETPTPTPVFSMTPGASSNPSGGSTATVNLTNGTRLVIALPNRFLNSKGQSVALKVQVLDASGNELPLGDLKLLFSSSRPEDFSISDAGLVVALKDSGYSTLSVRVAGTDLVATQLVSVDAFVGSSGGGGGSSSPSASPTPLTQVNANVNFEGLGIGEFQVNTYTTDGQRESKVAVDADGDFVVVWNGDLQDGSDYGIYGQRYNAAGVAQGSEFQVNTYTPGSQSGSAVAMDADGDFVVTWTSVGQDGSDSGIYGQRYNAAGVAQGSEFQVNTYAANKQYGQAVAMDADGDFVVTWTSVGQDGYSYGIYGQRYNATGIAQGPEFQVNTYTSSHQENSAVAMDADGDFVVAWQSFTQDGDIYGIYGQRYNAAGLAQGGEFQVNTYTTNNQRFPSVAMDTDGDFVVSWTSFDQDGDNFDVYGQRYNAAGVAQGSEFQVNTYTTEAQRASKIAMDADGDFVVTWTSRTQDASNDSSFFQRDSVYGQRYNAAGVAQGSEFQVNTYITLGQTLGAVAMDSDGGFVVTWRSNGQDGDSFGIYAKQYRSNGMVK